MRPESKMLLVRGQVSSLYRQFLIFAAAAMLGGCALNGDFGRMRPEIVTDDVHSWIGREAADATGSIPSEYALTDDERRLRDLAYPLIAPPYGRQRLLNAVKEYGIGRKPPPEGPPFDRAAYWHKLAEFSRRSEASAYAQLATDARNDVDMIELFYAVAGRVLDMDRKRAITLSHVPGLNEREYANALARNNENAAIVGWACRSIGERSAGYRYALDRLVIAAPAAEAADADRTLNLLHLRINQHCKPVIGAHIVTKD